MHILAMGDYGRFVWSAYGISAVALIAAVVINLRAYFRAVGQLHRMQTRDRQLSA